MHLFYSLRKANTIEIQQCLFAHRSKERWISKTWINNLEAYC
jgi:hypothetical protein